MPPLLHATERAIMTGTGYSYTRSVKSDASDELINTVVLRPAAGLLVRLLYRTPVTPNQVTLAATAAGLAAAALYGAGTPGRTLAAGLCLTLKDLLDSADGQLARAKGKFSRAGRFLDSIGDFVVNLAVFTGIAAAMLRQGAGAAAPLLCFLAFLGISLRVSYHVFYQASFLHLRSAYTGNRTSEELTAEDRDEDRLTRVLHRTFLLLYGWQDRLMARLDAFAAGGTPPADERARRWYGDVTGVRLSGFLGLGTELFLLTACSVAGALGPYLFINIAGMNLYWAYCVAYRRRVLRRELERTGAG